MPTFLVNRKMNTALAGRIRASLGANRGEAPTAHLAPRFRSILRFSATGIAIVSLVLLVHAIRERYAQIESARNELLQAIERASAPLSADELKFVERVEGVLRDFAGSYPGDITSDALRDRARLERELSRPAVYVRGPIADMRSSRGIANAASESRKDALLLCLFRPPEEATERAMLRSAQDAYFQKAAVEEATPNVLRLIHAIAGLPWLEPQFAEQVRGAEEEAEISVLQQRFDAAPIQWAVQAAQSELLIWVMDEAKERGGTELDGASIHQIRVSIFDLESNETLLRVRRRVDPSWVSEKRRSKLARQFNGCRLAFELREELSGQL